MAKVCALAILIAVSGCGSSEDAKPGSSTKTAAPAGSSPAGSSPEARPADPASSTSSSAQATPAAVTGFAADINPLLKASCAGALCHGAGSPFGAFVGDEAIFLSKGASVLDRITTTGPSIMPPVGTSKSLSESDRQLIVTYLGQQGISAAAAAPADPAADPASPSPQTPPPTSAQTKLCAEVSATDKAAGLALTFAEVNAVATPSCGGGGCHSGAAPHGFTDHAETWDSQTSAAGILVDIKTGAMPIGGRTLSTQGRGLIFSYICARHDI